MVAILLFVLYPLGIYLGYASALLLSKRRRVSKEVYTYKDVKSQRKIAESKYSVVRYPDVQGGINDSRQAVRSAVGSILIFVAFLQFEGYLAITTPQVIMIYAAFAILGLFYNNRQTLEWNLAFAAVAIAMGGTMDLLGASSGPWSYAFGEGLPVFISFAWALNVWAVYGIVQMFGSEKCKLGGSCHKIQPILSPIKSNSLKNLFSKSSTSLNFF